MRHDLSTKKESRKKWGEKVTVFTLVHDNELLSHFNIIVIHFLRFWLYSSRLFFFVGVNGSAAF